MKAKRLLSLLLVLSVIFSFLGAGVFNVQAYDYVTDGLVDPYYLTFMTTDKTSPYYGMMALYQSRHFSYLEGSDGSSVFGVPNILPITNGETGEIFPAYCLDLVTGGEQYINYRTQNLEDSNYYNTQSAAQIRTIFKNSFPILDADALEAKADAWLTANGRSEIVDLTGAEAMTATQYCIWILANADELNVENCRPYDRTEQRSNWDKTVYFKDDPVDCDEAVRYFEDGTNQTAHNITMLAEYLMSLEPETVMVTSDDVVATSADLQDTEVEVSKAADGTWTVTVTVDVDATVTSEDDLVLAVTAGDVTETKAVTKPGELVMELKNLDEATANGLITLELTGYQYCGGVFMYDAVGMRGSSQTMIGYADSEKPIAIQARAMVGEVERVLTIHKYGPVAGEDISEKKPLENIQFNIYKVATQEQVQNGFVPSENPSEYIDLKNFVATVTTDANGQAVYNFSRNDMEDGIYLVVELDSAAVTTPAAPFYVSVPMTNDEGTDYIYDIHAYPKNDVSDDVDVGKDVTELDNKTDTDDVNVNQTWIIRGSIPTGMYDASSNTYAKKYTITDTLDYRLTYVEDSLKVVVATAAGEEVELTKDTHYTLTVTDVEDDEGNATKSIKVDLTAEGIAYVVANMGEGEETPEIRVYFDTYINNSADLGVNIYNGAKVEYENYAGWEYDDEVADDEKPEVHTGGLKVNKVDASDMTKRLEGATFVLARKATEEEIEAGLSVELTVNGETLDVVYVEFFADEAMAEEKVSEVTTDENGVALLYGLAYGEYYLVETNAPSGYNLLMAPVVVTVNETSHLDDDAATEEVEGTSVTVKNTAGFQLPSTGGEGTTMFMVAGVIIIAAAMLMIFVPKKKKNA